MNANEAVGCFAQLATGGAHLNEKLLAVLVEDAVAEIPILPHFLTSSIAIQQAAQRIRMLHWACLWHDVVLKVEIDVPATTQWVLKGRCLCRKSPCLDNWTGRVHLQNLKRKKRKFLIFLRSS